MVVAMDAMAVAIHIKYALNLNCQLILTVVRCLSVRPSVCLSVTLLCCIGTARHHQTFSR